MNLEKQLFVREAINTFDLLRKNKRTVLVASIVDCLFFFFYGLLGGGLNIKIAQLITDIGEAIIPGIREGKAVIDLLFAPDVYPMTKSLFLNLFLLVALIYVLYIIFQGVNFWLANNLVKIKDYKNYVILFAKLNILWLALYVVYQILDLVGTLQEHFIKIATFTQATSWWSISANVLALLLLYFGLISYTKLSIKESLLFGIRKFKQLFFVMLSSIIIILVLMFLLTNLFNAVINYSNGDKIFFVIGAIILFPTMFFLRTYWALCISKVK